MSLSPSDDLTADINAIIIKWHNSAVLVGEWVNKRDHFELDPLATCYCHMNCLMAVARVLAVTHECFTESIRRLLTSFKCYSGFPARV